MTDEELIARLRLPWPKDGSGDEVTLPLWMLILTDEAADRIEALEAKLAKAEAGLRDIAAECGCFIARTTLAEIKGGNDAESNL